MISPKLRNSHQNNGDGLIALQVKGKMRIFDFGVKCAFKPKCMTHRQAGKIKVYVYFVKKDKQGSKPGRQSDQANKTSWTEDHQTVSQAGNNS